ncbi:hypothetical protein [Citreimonas salinaria]|uniref:STAS domain-containing protein n=1 Tax=Citreimonas salinaria TaxID=321339 RepID=A0A1H3II03_9RHOB|nr:hypothetical protein [Citreimonas salinaria]SDY27257.1 hypothetical protein SAMN05444340_10579 [Citreimonas salinaria]
MIPLYSIDSRTRIVHVRFSGVLDTQAVLAGFAAYVADPQGRPGQSCLVDLSGVEQFAIDFSGVCALVERMQAREAELEQAPRDGDLPRHALYAPSDIAFGTCRMYQSIAQGLLAAEIGVFRDMCQARLFLDLEHALG